MSADGIGDLVAHLEMDTQKFVDPVKESADVAEASGERIIRVIQEQQASYLAMSVDVVTAAAHVGAALIALAGRTAGAGVSAGFGGTAANITAAAIALKGYGASAIGWATKFIPQLKVIGLAIGAAALAWKLFAGGGGGGGAGGDKDGGRIARVKEYAATTIAENSKIQSSWTRVTDEFGKLQASLEYSASKLSYLPIGFLEAAKKALGYNDAVREAEPLVKRMADYAVENLSLVRRETEFLTDYTEYLVQSVYRGGSGAKESALEWLFHAAALRTASKASEKLGKAQEKSAAAFHDLGVIQHNAGVDAERAAELREIGELRTKEAVEARLLVEQQAAAAAAAAGTSAADVAEMWGPVFTLLEDMKLKIEDGTLAPDTTAADNAAAQIERLNDRYAELTGTVDKAGLAMLAAHRAGADHDQVIEIGNLTAAIEKQEKADKESADRKAKDKSAAGEIARLQDQFDLLTKTATKADIAMREAKRAGYSDADAAQIGALTAATETPDKHTSKEKHFAEGISAGSKEAYSSLNAYRAESKGGVGDKALEMQKQQAVQLATHTRLLREIAAKVTPPTPVRIGA